MSSIAVGRRGGAADARGLELAAFVALVLLMALARVSGLGVGQRAIPDAPPFVLCGGVGVVNGAEPLLAAGAPPRPTATIVSSEPLAHVPGKRVTAAVVDFPPGAVSPPHRHGGSVTVYVLEGTLRSQLADGPIDTFTPGGTFFEPLGIIHTHSSNPSATERARILAVFVHDEGATLTTYLE